MYHPQIKLYELPRTWRETHLYDAFRVSRDLYLKTTGQKTSSPPCPVPARREKPSRQGASLLTPTPFLPFWRRRSLPYAYDIPLSLAEALCLRHFPMPFSYSFWGGGTSYDGPSVSMNSGNLLRSNLVPYSLFRVSRYSCTGHKVGNLCKEHHLPIVYLKYLHPCRHKEKT